MVSWTHSTKYREYVGHHKSRVTEESLGLTVVGIVTKTRILLRMLCHMGTPMYPVPWDQASAHLHKLNEVLKHSQRSNDPTIIYLHTKIREEGGRPVKGDNVRMPKTGLMCLTKVAIKHDC